MQQILGRRKRSSVPTRSKSDRDKALAEGIRAIGVIAIVSYTQCIAASAEYYYNRDQSVSCTECIEKHRKCDGTFSLQELRKAAELKKVEHQKRRRKLQEIAKLRAALAAAESEQVDIKESIAELDDRTARILNRKILALGVLDRLPKNREVALGDGDFSWLDTAPVVQQVN